MWDMRLLEHSFSLPPDLIEVLIAAKSEHDLGIGEQASEHLLTSSSPPMASPYMTGRPTSTTGQEMPVNV